MLPQAYRSLYSNFRHTLVQLQQVQDCPDAQELSPQKAFEAVQRSFQQVLTLDWEQFDPAMVAQVQSYQTEINRQFRLLGMDMMYLRAARQSATAGQRKQQMRDRITSLIQFCEALLGDEA